MLDFRKKGYRLEPILSAETFAQQTWGQVDLGDQRLTQRAVQIGARMAAQPDASLPTQMKDPAALEGAYRLMNHDQVHLSALLAPAFQQTYQLANQPGVVLLVNDQTDLNYSRHPATTGLGPIGNEHAVGLLLHTTLAVVPQTQAILGLAHAHIYLRQPSPHPRPKWTQSPEGLCWETATRAIGRPPEGCVWIEVSDAGSDFFGYLAACGDDHKGFLVRVSRERGVQWAPEAPQTGQPAAQHLISYARSLPAAADSTSAVQVPARGDHPARTAVAVMSWAPVTLGPSRQAPPELRAHEPLQAWVLRVWEPDPPPGAEALEWILLSSLPVTHPTEARERVVWYTCRWLCEDFHQCLKTGCQVERSQLDDRADLENLIGFAAPIAVRLLQLRQAARQTPEGLAHQAVDPLMVAILAQRQHVESQSMPLTTFWRLVAQLGGFQGRKRDGNPGWRTIWRGWKYLSDLTEGARLLDQARSKM